MNMSIYTMLERNLFPDFVIRFGIRRLLRQRLRDESNAPLEERSRRFRAFVASLRKSPLAIHTDLANEQHYEVPTEFFQLVLGPHLKYSSGLWPDGVSDLAGAEQSMLELYAQRAELEDGMDVLDLGCGWGSFTLWAAKRYPRSRFLAVSNSSVQRQFIEQSAASRL